MNKTFDFSTVVQFPNFEDSMRNFQVFNEYMREVSKIAADVLSRNKVGLPEFKVADSIWGRKERNKKNERIYDAIGNSLDRVDYEQQEHKISPAVIDKLWICTGDETMLGDILVQVHGGILGLSSNAKNPIFLEQEAKIIPNPGFVMDRETILMLLRELGAVKNYLAGVEDHYFAARKGNKIGDLKNIRRRFKTLPDFSTRALVTLKTSPESLKGKFRKPLFKEFGDGTIKNLELRAYGDFLKGLIEEEFDLYAPATFKALMSIRGLMIDRVKLKLRDSFQLRGGIFEGEQYMNGMPYFAEIEGNEEQILDIINSLGLNSPESYRIIKEGSRGVHKILGADYLEVPKGDFFWNRDLLRELTGQRNSMRQKIREGYFAQ